MPTMKEHLAHLRRVVDENKKANADVQEKCRRLTQVVTVDKGEDAARERAEKTPDR